MRKQKWLFVPHQQLLLWRVPFFLQKGQLTSATAACKRGNGPWFSKRGDIKALLHTDSSTRRRHFPGRCMAAQLSESCASSSHHRWDSLKWRRPAAPHSQPSPRCPGRATMPASPLAAPARPQADGPSLRSSGRASWPTLALHPGRCSRGPRTPAAHRDSVPSPHACDYPQRNSALEYLEISRTKLPHTRFLEPWLLMLEQSFCICIKNSFLARVFHYVPQSCVVVCNS